MDFIKGLLSGTLFRNALPLLTMISAFLLFSREYASYFALLRRKFSSLIVPLVVWNLPVAAAIYVVQRYTALELEFSETLHPATLTAWIDALLAVSSEPANFPLYFLRDLFVLALLTPVFAMFYRLAPYAGLLAVFLIAVYGLDGPLLFRTDMLIYYYLGGFLASKRLDVRVLDPYASIGLALLIFASISLVLLDITPHPHLRALLAPALVWPAIGLLANTRLGDFCLRHSDASFVIFVTHGAVLMLLWAIYGTAFTALPYAVFYVAAPLACIAFGIAVNATAKRHLPSVRKLLLGGR